MVTLQKIRAWPLFYRLSSDGIEFTFNAAFTQAFSQCPIASTRVSCAGWQWGEAGIQVHLLARLSDQKVLGRHAEWRV